MFTSILDNAFNNTIRKHVIAFGSLFNSVYVQTIRDSGTEKIRVPISYGPKEKFIQKIISESGITDKTHVQMHLPRMGFEIQSLQYDPTRRINKLKKIHRNVNNQDLSSFSESPYQYMFNLYIFSRSSEHNLQIIEQIVPFFTPDFTVTMNMNDLFTKVDVPIILTNVQVNEEYDGAFDNRRSLVTIMNFTMKGYIYSTIKANATGIVEKIDIDIFDGEILGPKFITDIGYEGNTLTGGITWAPGNTAY